jgi:hypothetical protein
VSQISWVDEIVLAMKALGGAARSSDLYDFIEQTTERQLTIEWKASIRRTIEDHSSNSKNFRSDDIFEHVSHGHWKLRGIEVTEAELEEREGLTPKEVLERVFVREHRRGAPVDSDGGCIPIAAWCDDRWVRVRLSDGREIATPLDWYPNLHSSTHAIRNDLQLMKSGVHWPKLDLDLGVRGMLEGWKPLRAGSEKSGN